MFYFFKQLCAFIADIIFGNFIKKEISIENVFLNSIILASVTDQVFSKGIGITPQNHFRKFEEQMT